MSFLSLLKTPYHFALAFLGAAIYEFPSDHMAVIGVTGTKGKSSTTEMISAILEEAGYPTALLNSIRIKVKDESKPNTMRMSMPGRFFIQKFMQRARESGCRAVILEMTSQGALQYRHRGISLNALVFTNLAPEHIEAHGSYEAYAQAKLALGHQLARSKKRPRSMIANADDPMSVRFLTLPVESPLPYALSHDTTAQSDDRGGSFLFKGTTIHINLPGRFSLENALAAATTASALGVPTDVIARALVNMTIIPGRAERIEEGQPFTVIVDYAHTPESLTALYNAYKNKRLICVLGSTGGGRDKWKRPVMGKIASEMCGAVIITNEDPYDEDPRAIIDDLAAEMKKEPTIIMDRREAIAHACTLAQPGDAVLITGKGTDPTIEGPHHSKQSWSDAAVAREELAKIQRV